MNVTARIAHWSSRHRKILIFGWLEWLPHLGHGEQLDPGDVPAAVAPTS